MTENDAEILAKDSADMRAKEIAREEDEEYQGDFDDAESTDEASD